MIHILSSLENFWRKFASKVNKKYNNFLGKFRWAKKKQTEKSAFWGIDYFLIYYGCVIVLASRITAVCAKALSLKEAPV